MNPNFRRALTMFSALAIASFAGSAQATVQRTFVASTGVDYASSGALTHSAPNFDVALDIGT